MHTAVLKGDNSCKRACGIKKFKSSLYMKTYVREPQLGPVKFGSFDTPGSCSGLKLDKCL